MACRRQQEFSESCEEDSFAGLPCAPAAVGWDRETPNNRRKLDDELASYKQKLALCQDGQQRQANLVQRLQAKMLQYKEKCRTLEMKLQLSEAENRNRKVEMEENAAEYESAIARLDEERQRGETLASVNTVLREQLDQVTQTNQSLTTENQRIREEAGRFRNLLERREEEWRNEEAVFNEYFTMEHNRLLTLWRAAVSCRRQFVEIKGHMEHELCSARADIAGVARVCQTACDNFAANLRSVESQNQINLERQKGENKKLSHQLEELRQETDTARQQLDTDLRSATKRLNDANNELIEVKRLLVDKEKTIASLQRLRTGQSHTGRKDTVDISDPNDRALVEEMQSLYQALREISQSVLNEDSYPMSVPEECCNRSRSRSPRYASGPGLHAAGNRISRAGAYGRTGSPPPPVNANGTCYWGDSALSAVQAAFTKRGIQLSDLSSKLSAMTSQYESLKAQLEDGENERRRLEQEVSRIRNEVDCRTKEKEDSLRDFERCKASLQSANHDKTELEKARSTLKEQVKNLQTELERSQNACNDLKNARERMNEDLMNMNRNMEKSTREVERCQRCIEALEEKLSAAREEGTILRESLQCARLEAEIKATERADLQEALSKSNARKVELEAELGSLQMEENALKERLSRQQPENRKHIGYAYLLYSFADELSGSNADWKFPVSEKASGSCFTSNNTLDPDCVRMALQEFVQRYTNVKRDLEDAKAEVTSLQSRLKEQTEQTELWSKRLHQVQQALCDAEADKKGVDGRLSSTQTALMLQEEALRKNERDRKLLTEKISQLERQLTSSEAERQEEQVGDPKEGNS
ncbi:unnamed protein product [Dicrocoelium dendriticum]|nr:unnamed protein product [Dicrocoelium dendriticum]